MVYGGFYRPRIVDSVIERKLSSKGAVLIEGPKGCGKTATAERFSNSTLSVDDPDSVKSNVLMSEIGTDKLLEGDQPRLLDEWQAAPKLWDAVRHHVDRHGGPGQFIMTSSSELPDSSRTVHSGTGRFAWVHMRPMALYESGDSTGEVSLSSLFDSADVSGISDTSLDRLAFLICRGGWPGALDLGCDAAIGWASEYVGSLVGTELSRADGRYRDSGKVRAVMRSYSRKQGSQSSQSAISDDISSDGCNVSEETVSEYLQALRRLHIVEDSKAWLPKLCSKTRIRTSDTRYFVDPSIATASLNINPVDLVKDLRLTGSLFEAMAIRDLRVYAEALDGDVYHYRDNLNNECDAVIQLRDGRYALIEVKLGGQTLVEEGAATLKKVLSRIDTDKMGEPSFMAVITGTEHYAYKRSDGIYTIPLGALKN